MVNNRWGSLKLELKRSFSFLFDLGSDSIWGKGFENGSVAKTLQQWLSVGVILPPEDIGNIWSCSCLSHLEDGCH